MTSRHLSPARKVAASAAFVLAFGSLAAPAFADKPAAPPGQSDGDANNGYRCDDNNGVPNTGTCHGNGGGGGNSSTSTGSTSTSTTGSSSTGGASTSTSTGGASTSTSTGGASTSTSTGGASTSTSTGGASTSTSTGGASTSTGGASTSTGGGGGADPDLAVDSSAPAGSQQFPSAAPLAGDVTVPAPAPAAEVEGVTVERPATADPSVATASAPADLATGGRSTVVLGAQVTRTAAASSADLARTGANTANELRIAGALFGLGGLLLALGRRKEQPTAR